MQILLGANETVVKIGSKSINIEYIQHFINGHFDNKILGKNIIFIPESMDNSHKRIFLLKWLYALYAKKTNNHIPKLKELLVNRQHKPIKIFLSQNITYKISYTISDKNCINIRVYPKNSELERRIANYFSIDYQNLIIQIKNNDIKMLLKKFLNSTNIIKFKHIHIYDKEKFKRILTTENKKEENHIDSKILKACQIFEIYKYDKKILKKRYKSLAKKYHPDGVATQNLEMVKLYTQKFQNIIDAYEILLENL